MAKANDPALSQAEVKARFDYDPHTGVFTCRLTGKPIGRPTAAGYLSTTLVGRTILLHRLAYFYMYGQWPVDQIDHVNGVKDDNRIINIRPASASQNGSNRGLSARNTSGYKGVYWDKAQSCWRACIKVDGRQQNIGGRFLTAAQASQAYIRAARKHHKEFARWETDRPLRLAKPEPSAFEAAKKARDDATREAILARVAKMERKPERDWLALPSRRKNVIDC